MKNILSVGIVGIFGVIGYMIGKMFGGGSE